MSGGRAPKTVAADWVNTARRALVAEGIAHVRVDRIARTLRVTRGGFYHNFRNRDELLAALLECWKRECRFLPDFPPGATPADAADWMDMIVRRVIEEDGYDPRFDMAVREWARSDKRAARAIDRADRERVAGLTECFDALGYDAEQAGIRARVFYYHQIGFYAIGVRQSVGERLRNAHVYVDIICGRDVLGAAREARARLGRLSERA